MRRAIVSVFALLITLCGVALAARSQEANNSVPNEISPSTNGYAAVKVEGRTLFELMGARGLAAAERAGKVNRRLDNLITGDEVLRSFNKQDLVTQNNETVITLGKEPILSVTDADARDALATRDELALLWGGKMATAVVDARATRANPLKGAGILIRNSFSDLLVSALRWLPRLAGATGLLLVFWLLARFNRWGARIIVSHTHLDANLRQLLRAAAYYGTWTVGIIAILSTLGLEGGSIATTLGVSGFVLGFAFKDILSHFIAGLMLLLGRQFHIGDQIVVMGFEGTVERIELRALYLRTYDNRLVIIPNGDVFTSPVTSNTASPIRGSEFIVGIGYDDDIDKARAVALETVQGVEGVAVEPRPDVLIDGLAAAVVNLKIRFYANSQRADCLRVGSECKRLVKQAFDREHISMPTDIQTIVIQNLGEVADELEKAASVRHRGNGPVPASETSKSKT